MWDVSCAQPLGHSDGSYLPQWIAFGDRPLFMFFQVGEEEAHGSSASAGSRLTVAHNNPCGKVAHFEVAYSASQDGY